MMRLLHGTALALVAVFLFLALAGPHPDGTQLGRLVIDRAVEDTGSVNAVTAIYLGYRAFDTLGETIVLLLAVSGVAVLLKPR